MATITTDVSVAVRQYLKAVFTTVTNGDVTRGIVSAAFPDKSVQVFGTFGAGGNVQIQGSNDGGTTWTQLRDPQGNLIDITAASLVAVLENPEMIRAEVTAGDGTTSLTVAFVMRSNE